jgi:hypothetical protein
VVEGHVARYAAQAAILVELHPLHGGPAGRNPVNDLQRPVSQRWPFPTAQPLGRQSLQSWLHPKLTPQGAPSNQEGKH